MARDEKFKDGEYKVIKEDEITRLDTSLNRWIEKLSTSSFGKDSGYFFIKANGAIAGYQVKGERGSLQDVMDAEILLDGRGPSSIETSQTYHQHRVAYIHETLREDYADSYFAGSTYLSALVNRKERVIPCASLGDSPSFIIRGSHSEGKSSFKVESIVPKEELDSPGNLQEEKRLKELGLSTNYGDLLLDECDYQLKWLRENAELESLKEINDFFTAQWSAVKGAKELKPSLYGIPSLHLQFYQQIIEKIKELNSQSLSKEGFAQEIQKYYESKLKPFPKRVKGLSASGLMGYYPRYDAINHITQEFLKRDPTLKEIEYSASDWLLLASDGLTASLTEEQIEKLFQEHAATASPRQMAKFLVDAAAKSGSHDNISVIVVKLELLSQLDQAIDWVDLLLADGNEKKGHHVALAIRQIHKNIVQTPGLVFVGPLFEEVLNQYTVFNPESIKTIFTNTKKEYKDDTLKNLKHYITEQNSYIRKHSHRFGYRFLFSLRTISPRNNDNAMSKRHLALAFAAFCAINSYPNDLCKKIIVAKVIKYCVELIVQYKVPSLTGFGATFYKSAGNLEVALGITDRVNQKIGYIKAAEQREREEKQRPTSVY